MSGQRPATINEAGELARRHGSPGAFFREFLDEFYNLTSNAERLERLSAMPAPSGDPRLDAWYAAAAEHLCFQHRLTPPEMQGRVGATILFVAAGGNCLGAVLGGVIASTFGLTAPYWVAFVVAVIVSAATWRVFNRATVAAAYGEKPAPAKPMPASAPESTHP